MTPELTALTLCGLLQMVQFILFAVPANLELGTRYTAGPRDRKPGNTRPGLDPGPLPTTYAAVRNEVPGQARDARAKGYRA